MKKLKECTNRVQRGVKEYKGGVQKGVKEYTDNEKGVKSTQTMQGVLKSTHTQGVKRTTHPMLSLLQAPRKHRPVAPPVAQLLHLLHGCWETADLPKFKLSSWVLVVASRNYSSVAFASPAPH